MNKNEKIVGGFLVVLLLMCIAIVTLGGYVRLSGSGLSIPEWPFFTIEESVSASGEVVKRRTIFPPASEEGWQLLRATFVTKVPGDWEGIAMNEFKRMFWTEWSHRGVAKLIGLVYLAFMGLAWYFPETRGRLGMLSVVGLVLLVVQAVLGGIVVLFHLEAVQVALHLIAAFLFTGLLLWSWLLLKRPPDPARRGGFNSVFVWAAAITGLVLFQVFSGGVVAGSLAGFQMNTWPKMGEVWVPSNLFMADMGFFENFTENIMMVQFFHRWFAFAVALAVLLFVARCSMVQVSGAARWGLRVLFSLVVLQIVLGIFTLLMGVHTHLALSHQAVGLLLVLNCIVIVYETYHHEVVLEGAAAEEAEPGEGGARGRLETV